ncbi:uncharacterized protein [Rutidosis leptorrhynchoides]|uniref:uncharacterized protein n=1 Tax=Rutidosis leptorrhynchoides TaxID=125765 RepID=UPI003A99931E
MGLKSVAESHAGAIWRERLGSAFRTAIACTIIGCTALYGPEQVRHQIQYPSVAYVTAILIVSDATLGTALRGSWYAFVATVLVVPSTVLCLWTVGPDQFTEVGASVAVAISSFLVAVPEFLPLLTKRIAFAQLVIIYVGAVVRGPNAGPVTHPVHIAACTALGVSASVLALILPYPRLAVNEVKKQFQVYTENASKRSSLYMKAFLSDDKATADDLISQAEPITKSANKLLDHINFIQEGVKWEKYHVRDFKKMGDRVNDIETPIRGMKMALSDVRSFPLDIINEELKTVLQSTRIQQTLKLDHARCLVPFDDAMTVPERKDELFDKSLHTLTNISTTHKDLPAFFFLSCFELLVNNTNMNPRTESLDSQKVNTTEESIISPNETQSSSKRVIFALKCSISLGLAVLLGMFFDKKNGYWSGLTIAISFVEGDLPIFTVANARVQGTAIGTVYGVLGSCLLNQVAEIRFIILLPWIVFTSMLHHSKMLGESGGISAVIGALLILGRKNYGPPKEFAIARLTEVSIGLFCMVLMEIVLRPISKRTLVKRQLSRCLVTLDECLHRVASHKDNMAPNFPSMRENIERLKDDIRNFKNLIKDASLEPSFWFLPFQASNYFRVQERISNMVDLMQLTIYNMEFITRCNNGVLKELQEHINGNLGMLKENTSPCVKRLQNIVLVKSIDENEDKLQETEGSKDLEAGNQQTLETMCVSIEVTDKIQGDAECKEKTILHLNSLGFCIKRLTGETMEVENCIKEIIRSENPTKKLDFNKIYYKVDVANAP